jgi:diacylglycerol kinase
MADELGRVTTGYQHWLNVVFCPLAIGTPQWNFRIHLVAGLGAICLGCYFRISATEWLFLIAVLCAEALNTALERTVDLIGPARQPVARDAKDLAAAGVLIASLCSLIVGVILFGRICCDFS